MRIGTRRIVPAVVVFAFLLAILAVGCVDLPATFSYQGRLLTNAGNPVADGSYTIRYNLYHQASGGTPVFTDTESIAVSDGLFNSAIGTDVEIPPDTFAQPTWLEVTINGQTMTPRERLRGAPYAFSLASGAVIQGSEPMTRTFLTYQDTGSVLTVLNTNATNGGGNTLYLVNRADLELADREKIAALQARSAGNAYGAIVSSDNYRGMYAKGDNNFFAAVFDSNVGIKIEGGGSCQGCTMAYTARNDGGDTILAGDFVAAAGVEVDPDLNEPVMLVRKAVGPEDAIIGIASTSMTRSPVGEFQGVTTGGFDPREGPAAAGDYLSVVVQGLVQARVSQSATIDVGNQLTVVADGVQATELDEMSVARALSAPDGDGLVWVMFNGR